MRHATRYNKRDSNEGEIIEALKRMGIRHLMYGPLDLWCHFPGEGWTPVEIKTKTGVLTKGQELFIAECNEMKRPVLVLRSAEEAVDAVLSRAINQLQSKLEIVYAKQVPQATPIHGDDRPRGKVSER